MTLNQLAEEVHNMLAEAARQGLDPKDIMVKSITYSHRVPISGIEIDSPGGKVQPIADLFFAPR